MTIIWRTEKEEELLDTHLKISHVFICVNNISALEMFQILFWFCMILMFQIQGYVIRIRNMYSSVKSQNILPFKSVLPYITVQHIYMCSWPPRQVVLTGGQQIAIVGESKLHGRAHHKRHSESNGPMCIWPPAWKPTESSPGSGGLLEFWIGFGVLMHIWGYVLLQVWPMCVLDWLLQLNFTMSFRFLDNCDQNFVDILTEGVMW